MIADPTGLRFDRADLGEERTTSTPLPPGRDGWSVTGRSPAAIEDNTTEADAAPALARVIVLPPFNLRELAARHITAAELDRQQRGAA